MAGAQNSGLSVAERRRLREAERLAAAGGANTGEGGGVAGRDVPLTSLAYNPRNARASLDAVEGLAATFETSGVLQPCVVIPAATFVAAFPENDDAVADADYVVIGGNRRLAAAHHAGLKALPVHVNTKAKSRRDILIAAATENLAREELKPFEELATIEELKAEFGTYDAVAHQLGKSPGWVSQRRRLHNLQPEVREALETRTDGMTIELARDLGKIRDRDQQLKAWEDQRRLAAKRAEAPSEKKPAKPTKKVPPQGGAGTGAALDGETVARRDACLMAVVALTGDLPRVSIIAMQSPAAPDEAVALASHWLGEAGASASALHLATLAGAESSEQQQQAALALALAHCELHMTRTNGDDAAHARAFTDWLETHTDYQPTTDAALAPTA
ncbi:ParB/RepB/Spo0J family partition protein [Streptomyces sp. NPDC051909]|uniref:ParB/RepB/Spo0J family partition protein n=1 Tax=Streptomyces sp. NPDC051909 TaxID=3154944 RepID=UPI00343213CD